MLFMIQYMWYTIYLFQIMDRSSMLQIHPELNLIILIIWSEKVSKISNII